MSETEIKKPNPSLVSYEDSIIARFSDRITSIEFLRTSGSVEIRTIYSFGPEKSGATG